MRFLGSLFKEHLLPYALIHTLVTDLARHSEKARLQGSFFLSPSSAKWLST